MAKRYFARRSVRRRAGLLGAVGGTVQAGVKAYRSFNKWSQSRGKEKHAPAPITGESDFRNVYKRKPMPARRRKRWVRFTRQVNHVVEKAVQPNYLVITEAYVMGTATAGKQSAGWASLYGVNSTTDNVDFIDIRRIFQRAAGVSGASATEMNRRAHISGALMEVSLYNNAITTCYVDCYYWRCKRDCATEGTVPAGPGGIGYNLGDVNDLVTAGLSQLTANIPAGGSTLDIGDYGVTPFQSPVFSRHCQVWKKTRIKLAPGGTAQLELRDGKNYWLNWQYVVNFLMRRRMTQGIYFIVYGAPVAPGFASSASSVNISVNKNYTWRRVQDSLSTGGATQL